MFKWRDWRERLGLSSLDYPVPPHANTVWCSLGGLTLFCFVVTFVTGAVLTQFYNPTPAVAHASVHYIHQTPVLGFIRALHHWSANLGFALLIAHMLRVLFTGAYRPPRTITCLIGMALLLVAYNLFFTGTVLRWDQEGYEAMAHFVAVNKLLGPLGAFFQEDFTLSTSMLARMYGLHVGVLSSLFVILMVLHALYVKHFGIAPKPYQSHEDYQASLADGATFTKHLKGLAIYGTVLLAILLGLSFFLPPGMLDAPQAGVEMTKPPWLFWLFYPIESAMGIIGILVGAMLVALGLLLIPILGMAIGEEKRLYRVVNTIVLIGLIVWLGLMVITYFSPVMQHL